MGSAPIYITAASGAYISATVSWDSSGLSSGSSVTIYVDVSSSGGWRLKKGSTTYFDKYGSYSGSFTGNVGYTYQFQLWDTVEQTWQLQNFTVTQDSSGGGGGDPGGGDSANSYYVSYYDSNGSLLSRTTETEGYSFAVQSGSSVTRPSSSSSSSNYKITGDANGGTFSDGSTTASITATKTTTTSYNFSSWNTNSSGTGSTYYAGSYYTMPSYNLNLYPVFSSSSSTTPSNHSLSRLPQPSYAGSTTTTLTVTFNANGGSVSTTSQLVNTTVTKTFGGWMNSSGTVITSLSSAGTVKAKWNNSYSNATVTLPLPTRNGYIFDGWSTSTSGTNLQQAGTQVSISGNTTFYAIWTEKEKPKGGVFIHDGTMWQLVSS